MENTKVITTSPNIAGNIGSCEIKSDSFSKDSWYTTTIAVNSCNGQIVSQNTYFEWGIIYWPLIILFVIGGIVAIANN